MGVSSWLRSENSTSTSMPILGAGVDQISAPRPAGNTGRKFVLAYPTITDPNR